MKINTKASTTLTPTATSKEDDVSAESVHLSVLCDSTSGRKQYKFVAPLRWTEKVKESMLNRPHEKLSQQLLNRSNREKYQIVKLKKLVLNDINVTYSMT